MIGQDGFLAGLALGKTMGDKEFDNEVFDLKNRLKAAQKKGDVAHPQHLGMIETVNALVQEIDAIENGRIPADQARLSARRDNSHLEQFFREEASAAMNRLSNGSLDLGFEGPPHKGSRLASAVSDRLVKIVPATSKPKSGR